MARKKRTGPNKSAAIRAELDKDPTATAKTIVPALAKQGIEVNQTLVNNVRHKYLHDKKSPTKKSKTRKKMHSTSSGSAVSYDELLDAKRAAESMGGIDRAINALNALKKLK